MAIEITPEAKGPRVITVRVLPVRQWFGKGRKRRQYRFEIVAGNGRRIDPRDTYSNVGDIEAIVTKLVASGEPVRLDIDNGDGSGELKTLRAKIERIARGNRGFNSYGDPVETDYRDLVEVYQSSAAGEPCCWLRIHDNEEPDSRHREAGDMTAHLTLDQAVAIRDRLNAFIDDAREEFGR